MVDSYGGFQPSRIFDPQVVGAPTVVNRSFTATGTPASEPSGSPAARLSSTCAGLRERVLGGHVQERPHLAVHGGDPVQVRLGDLGGGHVACGHRGGQFRRGHRGQIVHGFPLTPRPGSAAP